MKNTPKIDYELPNEKNDLFKIPKNKKNNPTLSLTFNNKITLPIDFENIRKNLKSNEFNEKKLNGSSNISLSEEDYNSKFNKVSSDKESEETNDELKELKIINTELKNDKKELKKDNKELKTKVKSLIKDKNNLFTEKKVIEKDYNDLKIKLKESELKNKNSHIDENILKNYKVDIENEKDIEINKLLDKQRILEEEIKILKENFKNEINNYDTIIKNLKNEIKNYENINKNLKSEKNNYDSVIKNLKNDLKEKDELKQLNMKISEKLENLKDQNYDLNIIIKNIKKEQSIKLEKKFINYKEKKIEINKENWIFFVKENLRLTRILEKIDNDFENFKSNKESIVSNLNNVNYSLHSKINDLKKENSTLFMKKNYNNLYKEEIGILKDEIKDLKANNEELKNLLSKKNEEILKEDLQISQNDDIKKINISNNNLIYKENRELKGKLDNINNKYKKSINNISNNISINSGNIDLKIINRKENYNKNNTFIHNNNDSNDKKDKNNKNYSIMNRYNYI